MFHRFVPVTCRRLPDDVGCREPLTVNRSPEDPGFWILTTVKPRPLDAQIQISDKSGIEIDRKYEPIASLQVVAHMAIIRRFILVQDSWIKLGVVRKHLGMSSSQHSAALFEARGKKFNVSKRQTPNPGPDEVLIEAKAFAINPIDNIQQTFGYHVTTYPSVLGSDVAGVVVAVGSDVNNFKIGDRVTAFAPCLFKYGSPDYGAFQEKVLVPQQFVVSIPSSMSFDNAAMLPLAVSTAWLAFLCLGIPRDTQFKPVEKNGILIWSAASSVGSAVLQIAVSMGFNVYATASPKHHAYLQTLAKGPGKVTLFDYHDTAIAAKILVASHDDHVFIVHAIVAAGEVGPCIQVLDKVKGGDDVLAKVVSIPWAMNLLWWKFFPKWGHTRVKFVEAMGDEAAIKETYEFIFHKWLTPKLVDGGYVPSPTPFLIEGGIESIQAGVDKWKEGVSGTKIVVKM